MVGDTAVEAFLRTQYVEYLIGLARSEGDGQYDPATVERFVGHCRENVDLWEQTRTGLAAAFASGDVERQWIFPAGAKCDVVFVDGKHRYWSTHCRHGNCDACAAVELAPNVPRRPAQCKTCAAPCLCHCHKMRAPSTAAGPHYRIARIPS